MNGYELTEKLRKTRRRHRLSAPTQALYYELVAICNEEAWPDEFKCSNDELCSALKITEKSLIHYRQELIQTGLLFYKSGKSKKRIGEYSFLKEFVNGCKIYSQLDSQTYSQSASQSDSQLGEKPPDLIKTKIERKKKNDSADAPVIAHWQLIVDEWFLFNQEKFNEKPSFAGSDPRHLKKIIQIIEKRAVDKKIEWSEGYAVKRFRDFLTKAYSDTWLSKNFLLTNLEKFIDKIILNQNGKENRQNHAHQPVITGTAESAGKL